MLAKPMQSVELQMRWSEMTTVRPALGLPVKLTARAIPLAAQNARAAASPQLAAHSWHQSSRTMSPLRTLSSGDVKLTVPFGPACRVMAENVRGADAHRIETSVTKAPSRVVHTERLVTNSLTGHLPTVGPPAPRRRLLLPAMRSEPVLSCGGASLWHCTESRSAKAESPLIADSTCQPLMGRTRGACLLVLATSRAADDASGATGNRLVRPGVPTCATRSYRIDPEADAAGQPNHVFTFTALGFLRGDKRCARAERQEQSGQCGQGRHSQGHRESDHDRPLGMVDGLPLVEDWEPRKTPRHPQGGGCKAKGPIETRLWSVARN